MALFLPVAYVKEFPTRVERTTGGKQGEMQSGNGAANEFQRLDDAHRVRVQPKT
ncbi:MAG TPA: hypothetical protein VN706_14940 [Gemmatimonadaceae bacterium]|jgi:hypothetical protein|nr:hypothetical protein [Gemmatimonadaceae bacterium]